MSSKPHHDLFSPSVVVVLALVAFAVLVIALVD
jgi:hypothetical protein